MSTWLTDHLIRAGYVSETGATRRARLKSCPRGCKAKVLVGLTGYICAVEARVDPVPLSQLGEALALLEGRDTVALHREGGRFVLDARMHHDIERRPAGTAEREDVLRVHRCRTPEPSELLSADTTFVEVVPTPTPTDPPF